jgi:multiple sugar transport system permease protein
VASRLPTRLPLATRCSQLRGLLPVALSNAETGTYGAVNCGLLLAGAVMGTIPCIVVYVALQRFYVRGLVCGALKG